MSNDIRLEIKGISFQPDISKTKNTW